MNSTRSTDTLDETFGPVCLRWSIDVEVDYSVRQSTEILDQRVLSLRKSYEIELSETLKIFVNLMRANYAIAPLADRIP